MPKAASSRTALPALSSDFALPSSTASPISTSDDHPFLYNRFRRPSLLQKAGYLSETRLLSPLATSFTFHARRRSQTVEMETENEKDKMLTDSSSSSETHTPPLKVEGTEEDVPTARPILKPLPLTPPRRKSSMDVADMPTIFNRRLSFPLKQPRILTLLAQESRPEEAEVKSEAAFQRLVASVSELPIQPRTPRPLINRGRYPEEAGQEEEITREDSPSDDDEPGAEVKDENSFAFSLPPTGTQPINIQRPVSRTITPAASVAGSLNGDDAGMSISETSSTFGMAMDIDMPLGSPLLPSLNQWRYTPPPTSGSSAMRSNKRKRSSIDDRFDPYPTASKRRAVSPSISYLRESYSSTSSPITRVNSSRLPIALPVTIPPSAASSATSSPTISSYPPYPRGLNITSSPTLRATLTMASPILRPLGSRRRLGDDEDEREIQGAGEAVNGLTLDSTLGPVSTINALEPPAQHPTTRK